MSQNSFNREKIKAKPVKQLKSEIYVDTKKKKDNTSRRQRFDFFSIKTILTHF